MTREEAKEVVDIFNALNDNRDALAAIQKDEVILYVVLNGKPKCITPLFSEHQYKRVERTVRNILKDNIDVLTHELDSRKITNHMLTGGDT